MWLYRFKAKLNWEVDFSPNKLDCKLRFNWLVLPITENSTLFRTRGPEVPSYVPWSLWSPLFSGCLTATFDIWPCSSRNLQRRLYGRVDPWRSWVKCETPNVTQLSIDPATQHNTNLSPEPSEAKNKHSARKTHSVTTHPQYSEPCTHSSFRPIIDGTNIFQSMLLLFPILTCRQWQPMVDFYVSFAVI